MCIALHLAYKLGKLSLLLIMDWSLLNFQFSAGDIISFLVNALICMLLTALLANFYRRHASAQGNRARFSNNFMLLALATMLIITIVKSSIALSLGLVGALSIVRFRAAIKDPEELVYLFLVISIGLGLGANRPVITIVAFVLILSALYLRRRRHLAGSSDQQMFLSISGKEIDPKVVGNIVSKYFSNNRTARLSESAAITSVTYIVQLNDMNTYYTCSQDISSVYPQAQLALVRSID